MWAGILLAYDSYEWAPAGHGGWPVSFFVVTLIFIAYLLSGLGGLRGRGLPRSSEAGGSPIAERAS